MSNLDVQTKEWLKFIKQPGPRFIRNVFDSSAEIENPANSQGVGSYIENANAAETPGTAPISLFDGMQTAVNLCRVKADFDPIDIDNKGDEAHFIAFTNNVAQIPFITLDWSTTTDVKQESKSADILIQSFVDAFQGILDKDKESIFDSVKSLAAAALSYAGQTEKKSNFAQNLLQDPTKDQVTFGLYSSRFEISVSEGKGTIKYHANYLLSQAQYSLSKASWEQVRPYFEEEQKVTVEDWLSKMKTPAKTGSTVKTICLD
jgi:hypothetical protein